MINISDSVRWIIFGVMLVGVICAFFETNLDIKDQDKEEK